MCNCKVRHLRSVLLPNLNRTTRWPLAVETVAGSESGAGVSGKGETALQNPVTGLCRALCLLQTKCSSLGVDRNERAVAVARGSLPQQLGSCGGRAKANRRVACNPCFSVRRCIMRTQFLFIGRALRLQLFVYQCRHEQVHQCGILFCDYSGFQKPAEPSACDRFARFAVQRISEVQDNVL